MNPQPKKNQIWKKKDCDERVKIINIADTLLFVRIEPTIPKNKQITKRELWEKYELQDQIEVVKELSVDEQLAKQLAEAEQRGDVINLLDDDDNNNNDGASSSSNKKQPKKRKQRVDVINLLDDDDNNNNDGASSSSNKKQQKKGKQYLVVNGKKYGAVGLWRNNEADRTERALMMSKITIIMVQIGINTNGGNFKFNLFLKSIPKAVGLIETQLYASASSKTEYLDESTLRNRVSKAHSTFIKKAMQRKRQKTKLYDEDLSFLMDNLKVSTLKM